MKYQLLHMILTTALLGTCEGKKSEKPLSPEPENITIAKKVFEHFNNHEWEKMAGGLITKDFTYYDNQQ